MMSATTKSKCFGWTLGVLFGVCAAGGAFAQAAAPGPIKLDTAVYHDVQVTGADGKVTTTREAPKKVVPGDEVIYEMTYTSSAKAAATNVVIDNPIPSQLTFIKVEGTPATAVSIDGGKTYGQLADLKVKQADGTTRPAQPSDVTSVRWVIATIAPGGKGKVAYHAQVK
jgi:uncharacterized repeat protein (TIGR01451 family)